MPLSPSPQESIRLTLARFCHFTDTGDFANWVKLFKEDGCFRMFGNEVRGRDALRTFIENDQPAGRRGLHLTTDTMITLSEGRAEVCSNFLFVSGGETTNVLVTGGRYRDVLEPCDGEWLFADREATLVLPVSSEHWGQ